MGSLVYVIAAENGGGTTAIHNKRHGDGTRGA